MTRGLSGKPTLVQAPVPHGNRYAMSCRIPETTAATASDARWSRAVHILVDGQDDVKFGDVRGPREVRRGPTQRGSRGCPQLIYPRAPIHTDSWQGYSTLHGAGFDHASRNRRARRPGPQLVLSRTHRAISNLKTWLQGTLRGVFPAHLKGYLDESVFHYNRRRTSLAGCQALLDLGTAQEPTT